MFECTAKLDFSQWMKRRDEVLQRNEVVKIGNVDLFPEEAAEAYERGLYIVAFRRVYQVNYIDGRRNVMGIITTVIGAAWLASAVVRLVEWIDQPRKR